MKRGITQLEITLTVGLLVGSVGLIATNFELGKTKLQLCPNQMLSNNARWLICPVFRRLENIGDNCGNRFFTIDVNGDALLIKIIELNAPNEKTLQFIGKALALFLRRVERNNCLGNMLGKLSGNNQRATGGAPSLRREFPFLAESGKHSFYQLSAEAFHLTILFRLNGIRRQGKMVAQQLSNSHPAGHDIGIDITLGVAMAFIPSPRNLKRRLIQ